MTTGTLSHLPHRTRVVIAGGGVAALEALLALRADAGQLVDMTLVADTDTFAYRSLQVGEAFGVGHPRRYSLAALAELNDCDGCPSPSNFAASKGKFPLM